jgi:DNA-binding Lrp family transcriptional regulator
MIKLDLKDKKILGELDMNARQSNSEIAKKVRLNKNTVNYKINQFMKEGLISGYYTIIDNSKLGYFSFRVYLKFFNINPSQEEEMISWLKNNKLVGVLNKIETVYDLGFMAWVKNIYEFDDFWQEFKEKFRKYFWGERVDVFSKVYHFKRGYLAGGKVHEKYEIVGERTPLPYDELDMKILRLLSDNARIPLIEMSEKLKTPPRTIAFRIKQLEKKGIIQGYRANFNLDKLGYEYYKINITLNDFYKYSSLFDFARKHPNIIYLDRTLSDLDLEMDIEVENRQKMLELIKQVKVEFNVRETQILNFKEYYKLELIPR